MTRPWHERSGLLPLVVGHVLSRTGNVVVQFSVPFVVLATGGDAVQLGLASAAATLPVLLGGPLGGVLVDRIGRVRSAVIADVVSGVMITVLGVLGLAGSINFTLLLGLVFLGGLLDAPGETARQVLLPSIVGQAKIPLERAVGFLDATNRASVLLGAPLAGLLVATLGPPVALLGTGAAFALAALVTLAVPDSTARDEDHQPAAEATAETPSGYWRQLRDGFRFVATDPLLRRFLGLILIVNMLDAARSGPLLPLYSTQYLGGAASLGIIVAVFGGCALAGSLLFGFVAHRVHRRSTFVLCLALVALSLLPPALGLGMAWMVGVSVISGLAAGALNPIIGAVRLERVPPAMRARVFGLLTAGSWAGMPIGALLGGTSAQLIGVTGTFAVLFGVYLLAALWPCRGGAWRLMERDGST